MEIARITYEGIRDGGTTDESVCQGLHNASRELRDRWLNVPTQARRRSRSVRRVGLSLVADKTEARSTSDGNQRDNRLPRKASLCESDDEDGRPTAPPHWIRYVHFGV